MARPVVLARGIARGAGNFDRSLTRDGITNDVAPPEDPSGQAVVRRHRSGPATPCRSSSFRTI
ncbi:MAG: hypothetical protein ABSC94_31775 [Polyangiaceae bacterium]